MCLRHKFVFIWNVNNHRYIPITNDTVINELLQCLSVCFNIFPKFEFEFKGRLAQIWHQQVTTNNVISIVIPPDTSCIGMTTIAPISPHSGSLISGLWNWVNTLRPKQNERHFAGDMFKGIFVTENEWILLKISLNFVPKSPINNIPVLVQIMAWCRPGDKPLSEPMIISLPTHICFTRPQWINARHIPVYAFGLHW